MIDGTVTSTFRSIFCKYLAWDAAWKEEQRGCQQGAGVYTWHQPWYRLALVLCTALAILASHRLRCLAPGMPASLLFRPPTTGTQTSSRSWVRPASASPTTHPHMLLTRTHSRTPISTLSTHLRMHDYHHPHSTPCRISRPLPLVC